MAGFSLGWCVILALADAVGVPQARPFMHLSGYDAKSNLYTKSLGDFCFVLTCAITFVCLRAVLMNFVLFPLSRKGGIERLGKRVRFSEQGWSLVYYFCSFTADVYVYSTSNYRGDIKLLWADYPQTHVSYVFKLYYLIQFGFYASQIIVVNVEEHRKDYTQMFAHHIITCVLMYASIRLNVTRVGNVILLLMDFCDICLPAAKMLRYLGFTTACDAMFVVFMVSWLVTRHILYGIVIWSAAFDAKDIMGGYRWIPERELFFTRTVHITFLVLLMALEFILCLWFFMIVRVAVRVVSGEGAEDNRSDSDDYDDHDDSKAVLNGEVSDVASASAIANGPDLRRRAQQPASEKE